MEKLTDVIKLLSIEVLLPSLVGSLQICSSGAKDILEVWPETSNDC